MLKFTHPQHVDVDSSTFFHCSRKKVEEETALASIFKCYHARFGGGDNNLKKHNAVV